MTAPVGGDAKRSRKDKRGNAEPESLHKNGRADVAPERRDWGRALGEGLGFATGQVLSGPIDLRLNAGLVGRSVHYIASVDSTNAVLRKMGERGALEGTVVVADEQTAGRGRAGRSWFSPPGVGLWLSVLLAPRLPPRELAPLSMVTAVSVADSLRRDFGIDGRVKWPNDVMAGGRKLGGILLESLQGAGGPVERLVVGIGLNVNLEAADLPPEIAATAVSMRTLLLRPVSRLEVLKTILDAFDADWARFQAGGFEAFHDRYVELSTVLGKRIEVASDAETIAGTAVEITPDGALVVEDGQGGRTEIWHGDVQLVADE